MRLNFSIRSALCVVAMVAIGLAGLRSGTWIWSRLLFTLTFALHLTAILGVVYRKGARRAFWLGFATFGWAYLVAANVTVFQVAGFQLLSKHADYLPRELVPDGDVHSGINLGTEHLISVSSFGQIVSSLTTLLFAGIGGLVGRFFFYTSDFSRSANQTGDQPP